MRSRWKTSFLFFLTTFLSSRSYADFVKPVVFNRVLNIPYREAKTAIESPAVSKLSLGQGAGPGRGSICQFTKKQSIGVNIVFEITCRLPANMADSYAVKYRIDLVKTVEQSTHTDYLAVVSANGGRNIRGEIKLTSLSSTGSRIEVKVIDSTYSEVLIQIAKTFLRKAHMIENDEASHQ